MAEKPTAIKFYTDTHIAKAVAAQLRQRGIDVVRCEEVGMASAEDEELLGYATQNGRVMITNDDFLGIAGEWNKQGKSHAGIMFCQPHVQGKSAIGIIVKECIDYHELIMSGAGNI